MQQSSPISARIPATLLLAATIGAGLGARALLGGWWAKYAGVALWAAAAYWTVLWLRPFISVRRAAWTALAVSWAVELFQLTPYPAAWGHQHRFFKLLLGTHFGAWDLPAYLAGVLLAAALHSRWFSLR